MLTIGIFSTVPVESTSLYTEIVQEASKRGITRDQDHPPTINVSLPITKSSDIQMSLLLLNELGAKVIVIPESIDLADREKYEEMLGMPVLALDSNTTTLHALAADAVTSAQTAHVTSTSGSFAYPKTTEHAPKQLIEHCQVIAQRTPIVGAICGAGPLAGAEYCAQLALSAVPFIMISDTTAPDKNNAILGTGPDFAADYLRDIALLTPYVNGITIACNTAHARKELFDAQAGKTPIFDIREATVSSLQAVHPNAKKVILLGTKATVRKAKLYHEPLEKAGFTIIEPSENQLERIHKCIYAIKAWKGDNPTALALKQEINAVIKEIRQGENTPVILGCTELNVPFSTFELINANYISTSHALASYTQSRFESHSLNRTTDAIRRILAEGKRSGMDFANRSEYGAYRAKL